jgi:hypothetical protein
VDSIALLRTDVPPTIGQLKVRTRITSRINVPTSMEANPVLYVSGIRTVNESDHGTVEVSHIGSSFKSMVGSSWVPVVLHNGTTNLTGKLKAR